MYVECALRVYVQRKKYFFQDIFGKKTVNVIVNDVEGQQRRLTKLFITNY